MKIFKIAIFLLFANVAFSNDKSEEKVTVSYFRDELSFIEDIRLPNEEIDDGQYLKTIRDSNKNVVEILWYSESDSLLRKRNYEYDKSGDLSLISYFEKGRLKSELWLQDIYKSYDYFQFVFGFGFLPIESNRLTEVVYNIQLLPEKYVFYSQSNKIIGLINIDYDFENENVKETWFLGNRKKEIRKLDYKYTN
ncbi:MAG: hypothetical protein ISR90_05030 [Candidatus Marinimicrobia bacterium]|nr:hypothetical protein [Candidatus Neomarinimicrobiota bacterium]MBL7023399.1 hypothetical protein [Candidatus Neomarinimicrobiota bacterium]MBL7109780.1 hypothetical protein [Candidatus Neomarinimicrobiota bacterium]